MELWLDGVEREMVERAKDLGILHGVTTNPAILAKTGKRAEDVLEELLNLFSGPVAVQVTVRTSAEMIDQGKDLYDFSSRIIVKVPVTEEGIRAISRLTHNEIPTMGTAVFTPLQAFLAAEAGARYIAPYFSHIGGKAFEVTQAIQDILDIHALQAKLCIAALTTPKEVEECLVRGFRAVTLKPELFQQCLTPPAKVFEHLDRFDSDWSRAAPSDLLVSQQLIK
jgi:TalC/MipB family fructose-6-phosphate aldolase